MRRAAVLLFLLAAGAAGAHPLRLSTGDYRAHGQVVEVRLRLAAQELAAVTRLDADGDGRLTQADLDALGAALPRTLLGELRVAAGASACTFDPPGPARLDADERAAAGAEPDGIAVTGTFRCPAEVSSLRVAVGLVDLLPAGHTHLARVRLEGPAGAELSERVAEAGQATFTVERRAQGTPGLRFLTLGIEHIFGGWDHLAFLFALLLLGGSAGALVRIVTSFTVAHSVTLALATLGVLVPPARVVEPLIALSILAVAAENLWALRAGPARAAQALAHRWALTFAFGLVHGFGFASALRELELPREHLATALVSFNLGVELGQVAVVALALPLLAAAQRAPAWSRWGPRGASAAVGLAGVWWTIERLS